MKRYKTIILTAALGCLILLLENCTSSVLVDEWSDASYHGSSLKNIFVIAIRKDPVQRRIWEDAFVSELTKNGVKATQSYHLFQNALPDTSQLNQIVQEKGFDGILITRLLTAETKTYSVQSTVTTERRTRYNIFRQRYETYYHDVLHPGYTESYSVDRRAIDVWVIGKEDRLIWSATSNSPERFSVADVQNDIASLVIPELFRNSIIKEVNK